MAAIDDVGTVRLNIGKPGNSAIYTNSLYAMRRDRPGYLQLTEVHVLERYVNRWPYDVRVEWTGDQWWPKKG